MAGIGRQLENVFFERSERSMKFREVYLKANDLTKEAKTSIGG